MDFGRAFAIAFNTGNNRKLKEGEVDETELVRWRHALIGIAILIVVQAALIYWPKGEPLNLRQVLGVTVLAFVPLLVPFIVFWLGAAMTRNIGRLPATFLYLGIAFAIIQVVAVVFASFGGAGQSGPVLGVFLAFTFLAARGFLKLAWGPAVVVSLAAVGGLFGVTFVLLISLEPLLR
jgi:hypothetical protein